MAAKPHRVIAPLWFSSATMLQVGVKVRKSITDDWIPVAGVSLEVRLEDVPDTFKNGDEVINLKLYGLQKLFQERVSQQDNPNKKVEELTELWNEALSKGEWTLPRERADRKDYTYLFLAIAEKKGFSLPAIKKGWAALLPEGKAKLIEEYGPRAEELKAEAADEVNLLD